MSHERCKNNVLGTPDNDTVNGTQEILFWHDIT